MGHFGESSIPAVQEEGVPRVLRAVFYCANGKRTRLKVEALRELPNVIPAEHINHEDIVEAITVDVGKVHAHGGKAELTKAQGRGGAEMAMAVIEPDTIGSLEIIADVNIRGAIAIQIAKGDGESPIERRPGQGDA